MFAATTTKFDYGSEFQQALDRDAVRANPTEVGLDDGAVAIFENQADPAAPIFRRNSVTPRLFAADLAGEWARA